MLPVRPPVAPMLAKLARELPVADGLVYEPKWDGFRCIVFRDGEDVSLESRNERPLTRYFPELVDAIRRELPAQCVIDGEVVIAGPTGLDFDALLQRVHPAESRVQRLARETPASFVAFDLLADADADWRGRPFAERRARLVELLASARPPVYVTPATTDPEQARDWFSRFEGAGLDGVVAKPASVEYLEDKRAMVKVKHDRTADCVVGGYRVHKAGGVGSLLLGLFDDGGLLHRVGVCSSFSVARRAELLDELAATRLGADELHPWLAAPDDRPTDAPNRWSQGRDTSWEPLRPTLVVEVAYDHLQGDRFRHATSFRRWRPDRDPSSCTYGQLDTPVPAELAAIFDV
ncbi:MAG TPA: ATP-dependent DNA ligase [Acidimicrobiales bacterium]|nr:ATP-dependent DNA ligase [Acidimicrobiales bacterium]